MNLEAMLVSTGVVTLAEMGDKTQDLKSLYLSLLVFLSPRFLTMDLQGL